MPRSGSPRREEGDERDAAAGHEAERGQEPRARPDRAARRGEAIPSERQLTSELGVSRLTVRAALDELVREGMLVRRHGSGTFVSEPKIAQELTMTSFTEDMRRRGMVPGSRTLDIHVARGGAPGTAAARVALRAGRDHQPPPARRPRDDGDRDAPRPRVPRPGHLGRRPRAAVVLRAPRGPLRHRRSSAACRRSSRRSRTRRSPRRSASRCTRRPSSSSGRPGRRAARSWSTCARSTAATATGSSPS